MPSDTVQPNSSQDSPTPQQRRAMRDAIFSQCLASLSTLAMSFGIVLLYLKALGFGDDEVVLFLALPMIADAVVRIPCAFLGDRYGKNALSIVGGIVEMIGFVILCIAPFLPDDWLRPALYTGVILNAAGMSAFGATWFALLSPIVPQTMRGRFFGRLRISWQLVGIVFFLLCTPLFDKSTSPGMFQLVMGFCAVGLVARLFFAAQLPELENTRLPPGRSAFAVATEILQTPGYASFICYLFLLTLVTAHSPTIFNLIEKEIIHFGDDRIIAMGTLMMIGSVVGYYVGGKAVDRWGTKPVFLRCHFGYAAVLILFLLRPADAGLWKLTFALGALHMAFGFVMASSSIAIATELLALIPADNKSVSTSICQTLGRIGAALAGLACSGMLKFEVLSPTWTLGGRTMSQYDTILLAYAVMILLFVVTLGLVPSVLRKAEWIPRALG